MRRQAFARAGNVTFDVFEGKAVLVDPGGKELITLNRTGTVVWQMLDGTVSEADLVDAVSCRFPAVHRATVEGDVRHFIRELRRLQVVDVLEA